MKAPAFALLLERQADVLHAAGDHTRGDQFVAIASAVRKYPKSKTVAQIVAKPGASSSSQVLRQLNAMLRRTADMVEAVSSRSSGAADCRLVAEAITMHGVEDFGLALTLTVPEPTRGRIKIDPPKPPPRKPIPENSGSGYEERLRSGSPQQAIDLVDELSKTRTPTLEQLKNLAAILNVTVTGSSRKDVLESMRKHFRRERSAREKEATRR